MIRALAVCLFVALPFAVAAQFPATSDAPLDAPDVAVSGDIDGPAKAGETGKRQDDPSSQEKRNVAAAANNGENDEGDWRWWVGIVADGAAIVSSIVLAIAGIAGLRYLRGQVAAMEKSNCQTRKSIELSHRARIGIVRIDHDPIDPGMPIRMFVTLENVGGGVAREIETMGGTDLRRGAIPDSDFPLVMEKTPGAATVLHPGMKIELEVSGPTLVAEEIAKLGSGEYRLHVFARIL